MTRTLQLNEHLQLPALIDIMPVSAYNGPYIEAMNKKSDHDKRATTNHKFVAIKINSKEEKEVIWRPEKLREEIKKDWPEQVRRNVGFQLGRVQQGLDPDHFREMPSIAAGVREIKIQDGNKSQYRLIYVAKFKEGIYVFHVITKKTTEKTDKADLQRSQMRYREIVENRRKNKLS